MVIPTIRQGLGALTDLAWPCSCAGCGAWGPSWCAECEARTVLAPLRVRPRAAPHLVVHAAARFDGALRHAVSGFKDDGRRDVAPVLVRLLRHAVADAIQEAMCGGLLAVPAHRTATSPVRIVLVPVPSTRRATRARGRFDLGELAQLACGDSPLTCVPALMVRGRVRDQTGLGLEARRANVAGAVVVVPRKSALLVGERPPAVVLVDDVVTTGASLAAAHEALVQGGAHVIGCATAAATPLR